LDSTKLYLVSPAISLGLLSLGGLPCGWSVLCIPRLHSPEKKRDDKELESLFLLLFQ
jgi:hypothetical protein